MYCVTERALKAIKGSGVHILSVNGIMTLVYGFITSVTDAFIIY